MTTLKNRAKILAVGCIFLLMCALMPACSQGTNVLNGTAGTILGEDITEQQIADYIDSFRSTLGYSSEDAWKEYLSDNDTTVKQLRTATLYELAGDVVINKKAEELGLSVSDEEVDEQIESFKAALMITDDETWQSTLSFYKTSEEDLRARYRQGLLQEKVYEAVVGEITPTDQDMVSYMEENLLGTTTKKFQVFYSASYSDLQKVLNSIQAAGSVAEGVEAAKASADGSVIVFEDYGWDIDPDVTSSMSEELADLEVGQVSETLNADSEVGAYEIIYVVDSYTFPSENPTTAALPDTLKTMVSKLAKTRVYNLSCSSWLNEQIEKNLTENDMPSGLPYDVS